MKIAREGIPYILTPALVMLLLAALGYWYVAGVFLFLAAFMAFFFRDPERQPPTATDVVVAPADGRVTRVRQLEPKRTDSPTLVSIFLSPLDVHINRSPLGGKITDVTYTSGKFLMATNENASLVNEQNTLTIEGDRITVVCKQIAGILARRIVCWRRKGDRVALGDRIGLIKFSSRTDVVMPEQVEVLVTEGMRVQGGTTIIGRIR
ncbi:MAG TPA: phosphatidylserine decarboxylase family protein [Pyrinomonadaceae bacterium]|nr:phosphatidylserine decarboxylase family protein [Pyrinomonadaceae bacterium]